MKKLLSQSIENFLKAIYELRGEDGWVSQSALTNRLEHSSASVTNMIKKLSGKPWNMLEYEPQLPKGNQLQTPAAFTIGSVLS